MPRTNRSSQIDLSVAHAYHVVARCARGLGLLGADDPEAAAQRKGVVLYELERLARSMAVGVAGFAVLDDRVQLLLRAEPHAASRLSDTAAVRRWLTLHPPRNSYFQRLAVTDDAVAAFLAEPDAADTAREKLGSISQFMKEFQQEVTRKVNALDGQGGGLWQGRFKCTPVCDAAAMLHTLARIDLAAYAAGVGSTPEAHRHTSLAGRLGYLPADPPPLLGEEGARHRRSKKTPAQDLHTPPRPRREAARQAVDWRARDQAPACVDDGWWLAWNGAGSALKPRGNARTPNAAPPVGWVGYLRLLDAAAVALRPGQRRIKADAPAPRIRIEGVTAKSVCEALCEGFKKS